MKGWIIKLMFGVISERDTQCTVWMRVHLHKEGRKLRWNSHECHARCKFAKFHVFRSISQRILIGHEFEFTVARKFYWIIRQRRIIHLDERVASREGCLNFF